MWSRSKKESASQPGCRHSPATDSAAESPEAAATRADDAPSNDVQTARTFDGKCPICKEEQKAARIYRTKLMAGLMLPFTLQALDITIIAGALPWIADDFGEIPQLNWIVASFNLTSAAFIPFWGQMADIFGRHWCLQASTVFMLIGSALCTGAPLNAFPVLLLGRGLQGVGAAGIDVLVAVVLADKVSLKENAKNNSIFAFVGGCSYGVGPVLGGYLTRTDWRLCFGINLPICVVAMVVLFFIRDIFLGPQPLQSTGQIEPSQSRSWLRRRLETIDVGGQLLSLLSFGLLILALTWAGATYAWDTAAVLVPLVVGVLLSIGFVFWQYSMTPNRLLSRIFPLQKPLLPWELLRQRNIGCLFYVNIATGMGMYAVLYFTNLYFTMVKGRDSSSAGVQLLYYVPGIGGGVWISMAMCNFWPCKTWWPIFIGSIIEAVGVGLLAFALNSERDPVVYGMTALSGAGTGMRLMPGTIHAVGFFPGHISTVVAFMGVAFPFGGTIGLTVMATVFNNLSNMSTEGSFDDFSALQDLPEDVLHSMQGDAKRGIVWAFVAITPFMVICILTAAALGNVCITDDELDPADERYKENITEQCYIFALLSSKPESTERSSRDDAFVGSEVERATPVASRADSPPRAEKAAVIDSRAE